MENHFVGEDSQNFKSLAEDQQAVFNAKVVIQRFRSFSGGDVLAGVIASRTAFLIEAWVSLRVLNGKDVGINSNLFAVGDLEMTSKRPVFEADKIKSIEADKMIWKGREYTMRGKPYPVPAAGGFTFWKSVWRMSE